MLSDASDPSSAVEGAPPARPTLLSQQNLHRKSQVEATGKRQSAVNMYITLNYYLSEFYSILCENRFHLQVVSNNNKEIGKKGEQKII